MAHDIKLTVHDDGEKKTVSALLDGNTVGKLIWVRKAERVKFIWFSSAEQDRDYADAFVQAMNHLLDCPYWDDSNKWL